MTTGSERTPDGQKPASRRPVPEPESRHLEVKVDDSYVAVVRLNRVPVNAITSRLALDLGTVIAELAESERVRCAVLTGGVKMFSAGFDIKELLAARPAEAVPRNLRLMATYDAIEQGSLPVIAAVEGYALGGACELAMACDVRVAAEDAVLGLPEIKLGGVPGIAGMQRLQRLVGLGQAKQMVLTGERIGAVEAHRLGLVERLAPKGAALETALEIAHLIASRPPRSVAAAKQALNLGRDLPLERAQQLDMRFVGEVAITDDRAECLRAFVEKREPRITGQ